MSVTLWTNQQVLNQMDSGLHWSGTSWTYGFPTSSWVGANNYVEQNGFIPFNSSQVAAAALAIDLWDDLIVPDLALQSNPTGLNTNIEFGNSTIGVSFAHAYYPGVGTVWLGANQTSSFNNLQFPTIGEHSFDTYIHEIAHALGLRHMGNYNGASASLNDRTAVQDDVKYSVMSYWHPWQTGSADWIGSDGNVHAQTPMLNDIFVIQSIYGVETTTRTGNTVYGFNSNIGGTRAQIYDFNQNPYPVLAIFDSGGTDTLDLSGYSSSSVIDLEPGAFSSANDMTFNISIAYNTFIENASGGSGNDVINGNSLNNVLWGRGGYDSLNGGSGNDILIGGGGSDALDGGAGSDTVVLSRALSEYTISFNSATEIYSLTAGSQTDIVRNMEFFEFSDGTRAVSDLEQSDVFVSIAAFSASLSEGNSGQTLFAFNLTLSDTLSTSQSVNYSVSGSGVNPASASDFSGGVFPSGTVTFSAGQSSQTLTIAVAGDAAIEADETFSVTLSNPSAGIKLGIPSATGTIPNDDTSLPVVSISPDTVLHQEGDSGTTAFSFTVSLNQAASSTQTVSYTVTGSGTAAASASDFSGTVLPSGIVTFSVGQTTQTVTVFAAGDSVIEPDETFSITLSGPSAGITLGTATAQGRILDDDEEVPGGDDFTNNTSTSGVVSINGAAAQGEIEQGLDSDWFQVNLNAGQTYTFDLQRTDTGGLTDPYLELFDASGSFITFNDDSGGNLNSQLIFTATNTGTYYLGVRDFSNGAGAYTLAATSDTGDDFAGDITTTGSISTNGSRASSIEEGYDSDWFRITLSAGQVYTFSLTRTGDEGLDDPFLFLFDSTGAFVTFDDDSGGNLNSLLTFIPGTSGTYYLGVEDWGSGTGDYLLTSSTSASGDDFAASTSTTGSVTVNGGIRAGVVEQSYDSDWFRVTLTAGQTYTFNLTRSDNGGLTDPYLNLYDSTGNFITFDDDSGGNLNSSLTFTPSESGAYYLGVKDWGSGTGAYELTATADIGTDDYAGDTSTSGTINAGGSVSGTIETSFDRDWFRITLTAGETYTFRLTRTDENGLSDPYLNLYNSDGVLVAFDDDGGSSLNSLLVFTATTSGTYYLAARDWGGGTGSYALTAVTGLAGSSGDDRLTGDGDDNTIDGGGGNDIIIARGGSDSISGGTGNDTLKGGSGDDILLGGSGDDLLIAGMGTDYLNGGDGSDVYRVGGKDMFVNDYVDTGTGEFDVDVVDASRVLLLYLPETFSTFENGIEVIIGNDVGTKIVAGDNAVFWDFFGMTLTNIRQIQGSPEGDFIAGTEDRNVLVGRGGSDFLAGEAGNDTVKGGSGDDLLLGGAGDDVLRGNGGFDLLWGDAGSDLLVGGRGFDAFYFAEIPGTSEFDTVRDFAEGEDLIFLLQDTFSAISEPADAFGEFLSPNEFKANSVGIATDADDHIIYNSSTGELFYDPDGDGAQSAVKLALLESAPEITAEDIFVA